ncbi:MAG: hypothetical protein J5610_03295 [Prevotella sp.]|nr:hypothetical protein [Prevotella sp.]
MRKIITVVLLTLTMGVYAQNDQVTKIRQLYNNTKDMMANRSQSIPPENPSDELVVSSDYMAPGAGPIKDVVHYYFSCDYDEVTGSPYYTPYFISRTHNCGAWDYYEEFLYDKDNLVFYYCKRGNDETRYYWGPKGLCHEDIRGGRDMDDVFAMRLANDLMEAFNRLMNREY